MPRRNKHNARKVTRVHNGVECRFDSQAEAAYAAWLSFQQEIGNIRWWEHHPRGFPLHSFTGKRKKVKVATINPDFRVELARGIVEYHEVKGMATALWRLKRRMFEAEYPHVRYIVVDAGKPGDVVRGIAPELFDNRKRKKRGRK